ncbi:MAG: hypothetical protein VYE77_08205 [Planctomycetota bacterium]|nr:hypothetical protein [Planctomycetota bacterium]
MKSLVINVIAGVGLFAGAVVGTLAATGRLNHEGVANIPVLNSLIPAPAEASGEGDATNEAANDPVASADASSLLRVKSSDSGADEGDKGGHGHGAAAGDAEDPLPVYVPDPTVAGTGEQQGPEAGQGSRHAAEQDLHDLEQNLERTAANSRYAPGGYFRFEGMPAGVTPEQLNDLWRRAQQTTADLDRRAKALDEKEQYLNGIAKDIDRRYGELSKQQEQLSLLEAELDTRIAEFSQQVNVILKSEEQGLRQYAKTMESLEPSKVAQLIQEDWKLESGQKHVIKWLEFMAREAADRVIEKLPNALIQEVLKKRMEVGQQSASSSSSRK